MPQDQLDLIHSWGWNCETIETLKITLIDVPEAPTKADAWIISSRNSVAAVKKFIAYAPPEIFCVGEWMKNELEKLNTKIHIKSFETMRLLVNDLARCNFQKVVYFCGKEHRNELEKGLTNTNTKIAKMITHESQMTFPVVNKSVDAVFVFSPRSAESLLTHNDFPQAVFACIGPTTADYLRSQGITNTFISSYPDARFLLKEFYQHALQDRGQRSSH